MIFYSLPFVVLFASLLTCLQFSKTPKVQQFLFLAANIIFYGYWDVRFLALLTVVIVVCYFCALQYDKYKSKHWVAFSVVFCILILGFFKYYGFFIDSFCALFHIKNSHTLGIILPLGISFYIFQAISYVLDVKSQKITVQRDFVTLAVYISFFPQITSGPIVKARDFLPQLNRLHRIQKDNFYLGLQQFLLGLTKKLIFADQIGNAVNAVYAAPNAYSWISILFAVIGYSLQIYFDFSGYSDMAIGIAKIMDFDFGKNFNLPYLASNPSEFWKRWHISLSSWFQTYVYIPLGGSRKGTLITYRNLFITMLLSGLWHGANWTFLLWGALHALGSVLHKFCTSFHGAGTKKKLRLPSIMLNYIFVSLLWIVFRANSMQHAWEIFSGLFRADGISYISVFTVAGIIATVLAGALALWKNNGSSADIDLHLNTFHGKVLLFCWVLLILMFMYTGDSAFIYAQF